MLFSRTGCNVIAAVGCFTLIAVAYFYFENILYLTPCPLCYAQRIFLGIIGFFFFLAAIFPGGRGVSIIHGIWLLILCIGGSALSIRHLYLQNLSKDQLPSCGQDFYALVENTPLSHVVETMVTGSGDCGEILWQFMGLSIPGWTLVIFVLAGAWGLCNNAFRGAHRGG